MRGGVGQGGCAGGWRGGLSPGQIALSRSNMFGRRRLLTLADARLSPAQSNTELESSRQHRTPGPPGLPRPGLLGLGPPDTHPSGPGLADEVKVQ